MKCPHCHHDNPFNASFCMGCGQKLESSSDGGGQPSIFPTQAHNPTNPQSQENQAARAVIPAVNIFVGRQQEMGQLKAALGDASSGQGRLVMLSGEPGIGKSRILQEFADYARQEGALSLWGRCYENPGAPSYWPWVQVLRAYTQEKDAETLYQDMGRGAPDIAEIVPEVREQLPGLPTPAAVGDPEQARFRLFNSITTFFKTATRRQPLALFLDNLHWADKPSLLLLEFLAQEMAHSRLLVVGTYRHTELSRQHSLSETLGELTRERFFQRVQLRPLSRDEVTHFVQATAGVTPHSSLVSAIHAQTEGNPLFIAEVIRLLKDEGVLDQASLKQGRSVTVTVPEGVKEVIGRRLNRLSESCSQTLAIASVIGREFGLSELEQLIDHMSEDRLLGALEEAVTSQIIEEVPQEIDRYQFAHVLIRETLYDELTSSRRARLHHRIAEVMEDLYQANLEPHLAHLSYHFHEAGPSGNIEKAITYAKRAAQRDMALLAYEEAARYYEIALKALDRQGIVDDAHRYELLLALADAHKRAGESEQARERFQQAAQIARKLGQAEQLAQAAVGFEDASWRPGMYGGPAVQLLEEALNALGEEDSIPRVRALAALVRALYFSGLPDRASVLTQEAVEVARRIGDPVTLINTLIVAGFSQRRPETLERRLAFAVEALSIAEQAPDVELAGELYAWYLFDMLEAGDIEGAKIGLEVYQRQVERLQQPFFACVSASYRASLAIAQGRFEEGEQLARESLVVCQRLKGHDPSGIFAIKIFTIRREQGRLREVESALRTFEQQRSVSGAWGPGLALIYSELGMEPEARSEFERLANDNFAAIPQDALQEICLAYLAEVCVFLGDVQRADVLYRLLQPWEGHNMVVGGGVAYQGSAGRYLGMLAAIMGRWQEAEHHFRDALEMDARMDARTWLAHSRYEYAKMLLIRGQPADQEKALSLLGQALVTCRDLGMSSLEGRVIALQSQVKSPQPKTPEYPDGLTQREMEVLRLIAAGKSNREIADGLFISLNTVANHISNIFNKTSSSNRTEATSYAYRHRLVE